VKWGLGIFLFQGGLFLHIWGVFWVGRGVIFFHSKGVFFWVGWGEFLYNINILNIKSKGYFHQIIFMKKFK
jgi:hypothetical protein